MSKRCEEIDKLVTPYVDGEAAAPDADAVRSHADACPPCHDNLERERSARAVLRARAGALRPDAPALLHDRCRNAALRAGQTAASRRPARRSRLGLAAAAVVLVAAGVAMLAAVTSRFEAGLAAQLTLDHLKCLVVAPSHDSRPEPEDVERSLRVQYGWTVEVPPGLPSQGLRLLGARRCLYGDGQMAHLQYTHGDQPISLFVMFGEARPRQAFEIMGHGAVVWSRGDRTYAVVGAEPVPELQKVAGYVRETVR
jgi:anti-sigma factor RsiW